VPPDPCGLAEPSSQTPTTEGPRARHQSGHLPFGHVSQGSHLWAAVKQPHPRQPTPVWCSQVPHTSSRRRCAAAGTVFSPEPTYFASALTTVWAILSTPGPAAAGTGPAGTGPPGPAGTPSSSVTAARPTPGPPARN